MEVRFGLVGELSVELVRRMRGPARIEVRFGALIISSWRGEVVPQREEQNGCASSESAAPVEK